MDTYEKSSVREISYGSYVADFSDNGVIRSANEDFCRITGYSAEKISAGDVTFFDLIPEPDREEYLRLVGQIQKKNGGVLEHRIKCSDGRLIHVMCIGQDFTDENGHNCADIKICDITDDILLQNKLMHSKRELDALLDNVPGGVVLYEISDQMLKVVEANDEYYRILGYTDRSQHPGTVGHLMKNGDLPKFMAAAKDSFKSRTTFTFELKITRFDNKRCWIKFYGKFFDYSENGDPLVYGVILDITENKKFQQAVLNQSERFRIIAENTDEIYFDYDVVNDVMTLTNCINRYGEDDNIIRNFWNELKCKDFVYPDDFEDYTQKWVELCAAPQSGRVEFRTKAYDDDYTWYRMPFVSVANELGEVTNVYGRLFSIDHFKELKNTVDKDKAEIERLSTTDSVTGLLNRKAFKEKTAQELNEHFDSQMCYGIVYSDINDFSYVNDNFGFEAGNQMLYDFAQVIRQNKNSVYACRIYSDYYVGLYKAENREKLIEAIKLRNDTFTAEQKKKYPASDIHISCGLYLVTTPDIDVTIAMDNANLARRSVKGSKDVPCGIYSERMRKQRSHEQTIASELKSAISDGYLELFLQPKFDLNTRSIIGAEALSRWRNPDGTYKLPYEFINVLENVGYIVELDMYIFEQVLQTMARWKSLGKKLMPISINFSRLHNNYSNFVDKVTELTDKYCIDRNLIEIEITESCFTQDVNTLFSNMKKFRERGFKIDIDDFGMGYSSLSVLLNAPVDIVKVDKVFIDNIASSAQARAYINQICKLIDTTKKDIIFEGVETEQQAVILANGGHKMAQGWLFDKAISVNEFEKKYMDIQVN